MAKFARSISQQKKRRRYWLPFKEDAMKFKQNYIIFGPTDAAEYLTSRGWKTSKGKLQYLRTHGGGPSFTKVGQAITYKKSTLDQFLFDLPEYNNTSEQQQAEAAA